MRRITSPTFGRRWLGDSWRLANDSKDEIVEITACWAWTRGVCRKSEMVPCEGEEEEEEEEAGTRNLLVSSLPPGPSEEEAEVEEEAEPDLALRRPREINPSTSAPAACATMDVDAGEE